MKTYLGVIFSILFTANFAFAGVSDSVAKSLLKSAETGNQKTFQKALSTKGVDINYQDESGMTALMMTALGNNASMTKALIQKKANLEIKNSVGDTALAVAISNGSFKVAKELIQAGANTDVNVAGEKEDTLLIRAATQDLTTVQLLLEKNSALINKTNKLGETALMKSLDFGNLDIAKMLIKKGADTQLKSTKGKTALDFAKELKDPEALKLLAK